MKELNQIAFALKNAKTQSEIAYNYTIPQAWDTFGYEKGIRLRNHEMIVDPYDFYAFALEIMAKQLAKQATPRKQNGKKGSWIRQQIIYDVDMLTCTSWDHDRNDCIEQENLYHLSDHGTFLKALILLPLWKRAGITTLILHQIISKNDTGKYASKAPQATYDPKCLNECLADPLLPNMDVNAQCQLFLEVAHAYGMHVLCDYHFARLGRDNALLALHPDWFYWIDAGKEAKYQAPHVAGLPTGCIPSKNACRIVAQSDEAKQHLETFVFDPKTQDEAKFTKLCKEQPHHPLAQITQTMGCTSAPVFSDQINAHLPIDAESTYLRFYLDTTKNQAPYLLHDTLRPDLFPGKKANVELWDYLCDVAAYWLREFSFDGFYLQEPWRYPKKLCKAIFQTMRKCNPHAAIIVEESNPDNVQEWHQLGADLIQGNSAYVIHDVAQFQYHNFAYRRCSESYPVFAASEFRDTPRIVQYDGGETLAKLLIYMNLFLPNAVPYLASGQLSLECQPQGLSPFADQSYQNALPKEDLRAYKQSLYDDSYYTYTRSDFHILINQLEQFTHIRTEYVDAITTPSACIPVWFDRPTDAGIGFTYTKKEKALLVVCNTNLYQETQLTIHTENMLWELPFAWNCIRQIASSHDPFIYDIHCNEFQNIPLTFEPGEIKLLEITES